MSLNLVKRNSSSPFHLQRSMVDQGGEGGAYESGGYNPDAVHRSSGVAEGIAAFGKILGAGLSSRTAEDKNKSDIKKEGRLEARAKKTEVKKQNALDSGDINKADRIKTRGERVEGRLKQTTADIKKYNESEKPTLTSDLKTTSKKEVKPNTSAVAEEVNKNRESSVATSAIGTANIVDPNKTPDKSTWDLLNSQLKNLNKK